MKLPMDQSFLNLSKRWNDFRNSSNPLQAIIVILLGLTFLSIIFILYLLYPLKKGEITNSGRKIVVETEKTKGPKATASPTPIPIIQGKETYSISQGGEVKGPKIHRAEIDPHDPQVGQKQTFKASVVHTKEVRSVTVTLYSDDKKAITYPLALSSGTAINGVWSGEWEVNTTHLFNYAFSIEATDGTNRTKAGIAIR